MKTSLRTAGIAALIATGCFEIPRPPPDVGPARDAGAPAPQQPAARPDGGSALVDGGAPDTGGPSDGSQTLSAITCSPWSDLNNPSYEADCGKTVQLSGHSYAVALQSDYRTLCLVRPDGYRVIRTNSSAAFFFLVASAETVYCSLVEASGDETVYPTIELALNTCSAKRIANAAISESLDASDKLLALSIKHPELGGNSWEVRLIDRKTGQHRGLFNPTLNYGRPQVDDERLVMQVGGDSDGRVRVALLRSFASPEPERLGREDAPQKHPSIYGNWVAWEDYRNGEILSGRTVNPDIFAFNLATHTEVAISTDKSREERPVVFHDGICWADLRNGYEYGPGYLHNEDLYCRRFSDQREVPLDTSEGNQHSLVRLDSGLAWISSPSDGVGLVRFARGVPTTP